MARRGSRKHVDRATSYNYIAFTFVAGDPSGQALAYASITGAITGELTQQKTRHAGSRRTSISARARKIRDNNERGNTRAIL
jgi:hypothetical protein